MRQFLAICAIVGLFMYTGFVLQNGVRATTAGAQRPEGTLVAAKTRGFTNLHTAMSAMGAETDEALLVGWAEVNSPQARQSLEAALRWSGAVPANEVREATVRNKDGRQVLTVRWLMKGKAISDWEPRARAVKAALTGLGASPHLTVQLSGQATVTDMADAARKSLDAVGAYDRQPWGDEMAVSLAGRSERLPDSPYGINIQVALRKDPAAGTARTWVAWPALLQEY